MGKLSKYFITYTALILIIIAQVPALAYDQVPPKHIKELGVAWDDSYPSYSFRNEPGQLRGIIIDQGRLWDKKNGIKVYTTGMDWNSWQKIMQAGPPFLQSDLGHYALWISAMVTLIVFLLIIWNYMLQKKVRQRNYSKRKYVKALKISEEKYRQLINNLNVGVVVFSPCGDILLHNQAYLNIFGISENQIANKYDIDKNFCLMDEDGRVLLEENYPFNRIINTGVAINDYTLAIRKTNSEEIQWLQVNGFPEKNDAGEIMQIIISMVDVNKIKKAEGLLYELSIHDKLTGLYNRAYFEDAFDYLNDGQLSSLGLVICDLDGLKLINDTLGHSVGDEYLVNTSRILLDSFRTNDRIARIGGDEFAIIMPNTTEEETQEHCKQFKKNIETNKHIVGSIPLSISFGYSYRRGSKILINEMFKEADNHMYRKKLHHRQSIKSDIVQAMKTLLQERDFNTEGHAQRTQELACKLAERVGIGENEIDDIRLMAQFHDIGKVGISDNILLKKGRLNHQEMREMRRHSEIGARIAESSLELIPIADGILKHHEWWNGQGYPIGLEGANIPIQCRIIAIVDAYDAMVNDRPYRSALSKEEALAELKRGAAIQFDPMLVEVFIEIIKHEKFQGIA